VRLLAAPWRNPFGLPRTEIVMSSVENKKIVQRIFDAMANSNSTLLLESLAEDFRFVVTGTGKWSRAYEGR
jgi:uncharacterized protein